MHVSLEMKDGQAKERKRNELTDLPPVALLRRITVLDRTQELLEQRVVALEANMRSVGQKPHTTITPWRVLNSALVLGLGSYKAITTYQGQSIGPTTTDWIVGVVWTLMCVHGPTPDAILMFVKLILGLLRRKSNCWPFKLVLFM
jgi:hypothetical protein